MNVESLNGREPSPDPTTITLVDAQLALKDAAMAMGLSLEGAALSAYINGLLQSARVTALCKWLLELHPEIETRLSQLTVDAIITDIIPKLKAQKAPTILTSSGRH